MSAIADDSAGTVKVTVGSPYGDLLYWIAPQPIVCPAGLADRTLLDTQTFGAGPYTIESAIHGDQVVLNRRSDFKVGPGGRTPKLPKKLILKIITNETTAANLLVTGGLDLANVTGPDVTRLKATKSLTESDATAYGVQWLGFYQGQGHPTADEAVRQAIMTAVDRSGYNQAATAGQGVLGTSLISSAAQCYDPTTAQLMPKPSVDAARSILESDGYQLVNGKLTKNGAPLTVSFIAPKDTNAGPEYVSTVLRQVGIDVNLRQTDYHAYTQDLVHFKFDLAILPGAVDFPWPTNAIAFFHGPPFGQGGFNVWGINDPLLETLITTASTTTGSDRCAAWGKVQHELLAKHDFLPLTSQSTLWFSRLGGFHFVPGPLAVDPAQFG